MKKLLLFTITIALNTIIYSQTNTNTCGSVNLTTTITSNYNGQSISCASAANGEITITASGTAGPYLYQISGGGIPPNQPFNINTVFGGLGPGNYTFTVMDLSYEVSSGIYAMCVVNRAIAEPSVLTMSIDALINTTCHNVCDGQGFVSISGGTGAKTVIWDNGETGTTPVNLCQGNNIATITDINGCQITDTLYLPETDLLNTITFDGTTITSNHGGGNGAPYTFIWRNHNGIITGETNQTFTPIAIGNYRCGVFDVDGCQQDSNTINIMTLTVDDINSLNLTKIYQSSDGLLNFQFNKPQNIDIKLFNLLGKIIYIEKNINAVSHQIDLNINSGIYILEIKSKNQKLRRKILIK